LCSLPPLCAACNFRAVEWGELLSIVDQWKERSSGLLVI
jgi:hypothetical protein